MILGLDLETTGLDVGTCQIIEVGAVLYDEKARKPVEIYSDLVWGAKVPPEITALTGITQEECLDHGEIFEAIARTTVRLAKKADFVLAHNATNFDRPILERELRASIGHAPVWSWIDTSVDVPYPERITTRKLTHLAAEHGFLNPFPHRAVFDVMTMLQVVSHYDFGRVVELSQMPNVLLIADVPYDDREKAKARGYRWDKSTRTWRKTVKQHLVEQEVAAADFKVLVN